MKKVVDILLELVVLGLYLFAAMHFTFKEYDRAACEFIVGFIVQYYMDQRDKNDPKS